MECLTLFRCSLSFLTILSPRNLRLPQDGAKTQNEIWERDNLQWEGAMGVSKYTSSQKLYPTVRSKVVQGTTLMYITSHS